MIIPQPGNVFVNVGERTNVTGSRAFAKVILDGRFDDALEIARSQVDNGAQLIDINMDEGDARVRGRDEPASSTSSRPSRTSPGSR